MARPVGEPDVLAVARDDVEDERDVQEDARERDVAGRKRDGRRVEGEASSSTSSVAPETTDSRARA
jgi:hypothetical protein